LKAAFRRAKRKQTIKDQQNQPCPGKEHFIWKRQNVSEAALVFALVFVLLFERMMKTRFKFISISQFSRSGIDRTFKHYEGGLLFKSYLPELFEMDDKQQASSNETNSLSKETNSSSNETNSSSNEANFPSPGNLYLLGPPADERHSIARFSDFPDSSSPHNPSHLVRWSAQDLKIAADQ
jgi:hypothetical protein